MVPDTTKRLATFLYSVSNSDKGQPVFCAYLEKQFLSLPLMGLSRKLKSQEPTSQKWLRFHPRRIPLGTKRARAAMKLHGLFVFMNKSDVWVV